MRILWVGDELIRFWGQKVKGQGHSETTCGQISNLEDIFSWTYKTRPTVIYKNLDLWTSRLCSGKIALSFSLHCWPFLLLRVIFFCYITICLTSVWVMRVRCVSVICDARIFTSFYSLFSHRTQYTGYPPELTTRTLSRPMKHSLKFLTNLTFHTPRRVHLQLTHLN